MPQVDPPLLLLLAAGALGASALLIVLLGRLPSRRANRRIARLVEAREPSAALPAAPMRGWPARAAQQLSGYLDTGVGRALLGEEDKLLLDRAGFDHLQARALYLGLRLACGGLLALAWLVLRPPGLLLALWTLAGAVYVGLMLPKWLLRPRAAARLASVRRELPLLVDLLRLLQGSGMSLGQSLRVAAQEFTDALPVLATELQIAERQHAAGLPRADAFRRLTRLYEGDALSELVGLLVQLDRHGGAVDEPLRRFSLRLREQRRAELRARVGKRNVKMTVVMVASLLPALVIVIGGPAFLAIGRTLSRV